MSSGRRSQSVSPIGNAAASAASAAALSTVAAPAAKPQETLVLGMAFVREDYGDSARAETTIAVLRDRARLLQLEEGRAIISLNHTHTAEQCTPKRHLYARFDRRAVGELVEKFGKGGALALDAIYGDYFRFPGAYMRDAYSEFLRSMLPTLIDRGVMAPHTLLILPNLEGLFKALERATFRRPSDAMPAVHSQPCWLRFDPLTAAEYPLYAVTQRVDQQMLGGFSNEREIEQLHPVHPFVSLQVTDCQMQSQQSFALAFRMRTPLAGKAQLSDTVQHGKAASPSLVGKRVRGDKPSETAALDSSTAEASVSKPKRSHKKRAAKPQEDSSGTSSTSASTLASQSSPSAAMLPASSLAKLPSPSHRVSAGAQEEPTSKRQRQKH